MIPPCTAHLPPLGPARRRLRTPLPSHCHPRWRLRHPLHPGRQPPWLPHLGFPLRSRPLRSRHRVHGPWLLSAGHPPSIASLNRRCCPAGNTPAHRGAMLREPPSCCLDSRRGRGGTCANPDPTLSHSVEGPVHPGEHRAGSLCWERRGGQEKALRGRGGKGGRQEHELCRHKDWLARWAVRGWSTTGREEAVPRGRAGIKAV